MALVGAVDKNTGERLTYAVPEHFLGHPVLGQNLEPIKSDKKTTTTTSRSSGTTGKD